MANGKPSFFSSMMSGVRGYVKGAIAGGIVGVLAGAAVGAVIALFSPSAGIEMFTAMTGLTESALGAVSMGAIGGALGTGSIMATLGAFSGAVTGVVQSRETAQPQVEDVVNIAKASFVQGMAVGQQVEQERSQTKWQDRIAAQRGQSQSGPTLH